LAQAILAQDNRCSERHLCRLQFRSEVRMAMAISGMTAIESLEMLRPESLRAGRTAWLARELGLPVSYETASGGEVCPVLVVEEPDSHDREERKVRVDGMAINLYLCRKYGAGRDVAPHGIDEETAALRWSVWARNELEPNLLAMDPEVKRAIDVIEGQLGKRQWLIGKRFTVADINIAGALAWMPAIPASEGDVLRAYPRTTAWLERCLARPHSVRSCPQVVMLCKTPSCENDKALQSKL